MEEEETVANDIEWDNLENEDALTGIGSSLQASGPFLSHGGEGTSREPVEVGRIVGLPLEPTEAGGSAIVPEVPAEAGGPIIVPKSQGEWGIPPTCPRSCSG